MNKSQFKSEFKKLLLHEKMRYNKIIHSNKKNNMADLFRENYCQGRHDGIQWVLMQLEQFEGLRQVDRDIAEWRKEIWSKMEKC